MDEPTSALTEREIRTLITVINNLQGRGIAFLFVSHKLNEVLELSEKIIVMRNGRKVSEGERRQYDYARLAHEMTGHEISAKSYDYTPDPGVRPLLALDGLTAPGAFTDISFALRPGEILGLTGLLGCGRTELALALFGMHPTSSGTITVNGQRVAIRSTADAIHHGIGYIPEDRLTEGLFLEQSIGRNVVVRTLDQLLDRFGLLDRKQMDGQVDHWIDALRIKAGSPALPVKTLSGGNQQRVVVAKWLASRPKVLILNGPTMGVDIGSKEELHAIMKELAGQGMGLIVISDDLPELLQSCNRILLMRRGRIAEEIHPQQSNETQLAAKLTEA
jgi:simple sugar transport system ATP-binding protein